MFSVSEAHYRRASAWAVMMILLLAIVPWWGLQAAPVLESGKSLVGFTGGFTDKDFDDWAAGFKAGGMFRVDEERHLWLRTTVSHFELGPAAAAITNLEVVSLVDFYVGKRWTFYALGGLATYLTGENSGLDGQVGIGGSRRVWTQKPEEFGPTQVIPASFDLYGEISFTDVAGGTGSYVQLNFGGKFNLGK